MKFMNSEAKSYHNSGPHKDLGSPAKPQQGSPFNDNNSNCYLHGFTWFEIEICVKMF